MVENGKRSDIDDIFFSGKLWSVILHFLRYSVWGKQQFKNGNTVGVIKTALHKPVRFHSLSSLLVEQWSGRRDISAAFWSHKLKVLVQEIMKKLLLFPQKFLRLNWTTEYTGRNLMDPSQLYDVLMSKHKWYKCIHCMCLSFSGSFGRRQDDLISSNVSSTASTVTSSAGLQKTLPASANTTTKSTTGSTSASVQSR